MLKEKYVVYGDPDLYVPAHISYGKYILDQLKKYEGQIALIHGESGQKVTYRQLVQETVNLALSLEQLGVRKGDILVICSENRHEYIVSVLASICAGATVTTANILYTKDELTHSLDVTRPKYVFCSPFALQQHYETFKALPYLKTIIQYGDKAYVPGLVYADLIAKNVDVELYEPAGVQGQTDTLVVLHSSGTTGLPKGVMITHLNALLSALGTDGERMESKGMRTLLTIVPWHHAYGFLSTFNFLSVGRTIVFLTRFQEEVYLKSIQEYKVNVLLCVPPLVVFLAKSPLVLKYDMSSVNGIWCGAAPLTADLIQATKIRFKNIDGIEQAYGMTETSLAATKEFDQPADGKGKKIGSGGLPVPGCKLKVVDIETRQNLPPFEKGEICIKGPILMKGYVNNPQATADTFDERGWLKTGDIGYVDNDGFVFIVDRLKELIKYKSFQVAPAEVESVLLQHPGVRECGVVGAPDELAGELPTAFVVRQPGSKVTEKELIDHVASKLSRTKHLHGGVRFVDEVPKNQTGKILRRVLKEMCAKKPTSKL